MSKKIDLDLPNDVIYKLIKDNFDKFVIHKMLFKNDIQIAFKTYNNANKKSKLLAKYQMEYFQFIVKIENTYRSIMLCKKFRKDHGEEVEVSYYFKNDSHVGLSKYRDGTFIPIIKSVVRKLKIDNVLKEI